MKHNLIILIILIMGSTLFACNKHEEETLTPKITEDKVEATATSATFKWTVEWRGKLISVVEVSENEDMSHSQTYGSETETENPNFTVTVTDLKEATKYYYRYIVWNHHYVDNKFVMEVKSFTTKTDLPKVKVLEVTDITRTSALGQGEILSDGGLEITERGICWGTSHNPTTSGSHAASSQNTMTYSVPMNDLTPEETYYVRAYAKNAKGTGYSEEEMWFVTGDVVPPTVTTVQVTDISWRTAIGGGDVTNDGDAMVTERGVCWSTSENPTVENNHASSGTGTGSFTTDITGLTAGTTYHVRAYAKNRAGYGYGGDVVFKTSDAVVPTVTTANPTDITRTAAVCGGEVTSDGGSDITERGVCWSTDSNPSLSGNHLAAAQNGTGSFTVQITGLAPNTSYYVCSYATNSVGTSYGTPKSFATLPVGKPTVTTTQVSNITTTTATGGGNVTDDGGAEVTERGICWSTEHNPTLEDCVGNAHSGTGTGTFALNMTGLIHGTKYYVRAYATNIEGTNYGSEVSFTTIADPPTVITGEVTNIGMTSATASGNVTDDGGANVTERGVCWSTSHNPTISGNHASAGTGTGSFSVNMTGLSMSTTYYVRAYAKNNVDTSYGSETNFTTATLQAPTGAINGLFSVSETKQVWFSQGNLQYIGSAGTPYWKFAEHQWDYLGNSGQGSTAQNVDRDLFGWGTSGYHNGYDSFNVNYQPYSTSSSQVNTQCNTYGYGPSTNMSDLNLTGSSAEYDWGVHNAISNGGNQSGLWRTLTKDEWVFVFDTRYASTVGGTANARFVKATVNGKAGVILFPDVYTHPSYLPTPLQVNKTNVAYTANSFTGDGWMAMEDLGCVFLPAAGWRDGNLVKSVGSSNNYWSASYYNASLSKSVNIYGNSSSTFSPQSSDERYYGFSVRLVRDAQ